MDVFGPTSLQPLRLDRGRLGDDRHARRTCATRPGTAGKPPRGTTVRIYDDDGQELPTGETGRIFVGNEMLFEGYTGGGGKDVIDGLMASGDVGHFDDEGRLFVDGRDDDMIVSGGENVFPAEVEDLLAKHEEVREVAVRRRRRREVRPGAEGLRGHEGRRSPRRRCKDYVKANLARYKVPREDRVHRRAAAQRDGQGPQARAASGTSPRGPCGAG